MDDPPQLSSFAHLEQYKELCSSLLSVDLTQEAPSKQEEHAETTVQWTVCGLIDEYLEQSYLLDPVLEQLVAPLIQALRQLLQLPAVDFSRPRIYRVARLIYTISKVRGAKSIVRFFPHEVTDLSALLQLLESEEKLRSASWELRYILLLWLSVACRVPFDLAHLPGADAAISTISYRYLGEASKERDGAIALLARYHSRQDARLSEYLTKCQTVFTDPAASSALTSGLLETLCEILKTASRTSLNTSWATLYHLLAMYDSDVAAATRGAVVAKFRVKLAGRLALLKLSEKDEDVPEEVEVILQEMLEALRDKDTIVRWSAAKYIARISECLPEDMAYQISDAILDTFEAAFDEIDSVEHGLQGACFAFGELARRGRIQEELVDRLVTCALKALLFDRKRGVQSIGSAVRDSAAYVLWSLARTLRPNQISTEAATQLATRLVSVALYDRDIHIRRAASAAFQESVGRWSIFPHGIDVLRKIDFFTISVRKRAFLEAAPLVAEHPEYRSSLIEHILDVGLTHYDPDIRILAASSLQALVELDPAGLAPDLISRQIAHLATKDASKLHGAVLPLSALAVSVSNLGEATRTPLKSQIFSAIASLPPTLRALRSSPLVLSATLQALASSCTPEAATAMLSGWRGILHLAGEKGDEEVHAEAASAMRRISAAVDCATDLDGLIADLDSRSASRQQCAAVILGRLDYSATLKERLEGIIQRLVAFVGYKAPLAASTVEARRNGIDSLALLLCYAPSSLTPTTLSSALGSLIHGFTDYSTDQRGDVGSWVRLACISSVKSVLPHLACSAPALLEQEWVDQAVGALLKQAVERLDNVREKAGEVLRCLVECEELRRRYSPRLRALSVLDGIKSEREEWRDISWASERLLPLLAVTEYRSALLEGAVLAATRHSSSSPLLDYASSLPLSPSADLNPEGAEGTPKYSFLELVKDLTALAKRNFSANRLFIPAITLVGSFMDAACFEGLEAVEGGEECLHQLLLLSTRSLQQVKSAPRLTATVKIVVYLFASSTSSTSSSLSALASDRTLVLLNHSAPWLRQQTAEELHSAFSLTMDLGAVADEEGESELESLLLETAWAEADEDERKGKAERVVELLRRAKEGEREMGASAQE
ncbi:armadillo-type protein, partial [Leucosporidium creatinivorum]